MKSESVKKTKNEILQSSEMKVYEDQVEENGICEENTITNVEVVTPQHPLIKVPGDKLEQYMTPKGDVITKVDTAEKNLTHRQYSKKDGTKGKQTITFKQID